jgi:hypothetical protein
VHCPGPPTAHHLIQHTDMQNRTCTSSCTLHRLYTRQCIDARNMGLAEPALVLCTTPNTSTAAFNPAPTHLLATDSVTSTAQQQETHGCRV